MSFLHTSARLTTPSSNVATSAQQDFCVRTTTIYFEEPEESTESLLLSMWLKKVRRKGIAKLAPLNPKNKLGLCYVRLPGVRRKRRKVHRRGYDRQGMVEEVGGDVEGDNGSEGEPDT